MLLVVDARERIGAGDRFVARRVFGLGMPVIIALNKVDRLKPGHIASQMKVAAGLGDFHALHPVSAMTKDGVAELRDDLVFLLPEGPAYFPREQATDLAVEERVAEVIREKALQLTREEVPHAIMVEVEETGGEGRPRAALRRDRVPEGDPRRQARRDGARDRHARAARGRGARRAPGLPRARGQGAAEVAPRPADARAPRPVAARVSGSPEHGELERRIVTVLFCDLAGFTSLSDRLDAEDVAIVQNAYFEAVRYAVTRHGGTLEKFIGDAAVAVFGVPIAGEDDAERATRCGLAIAAAIEQLAARVGLEDGALQVRVGVNTGEAVVHPAPAAGEAMVTGDVVNTAARLQAMAPVNGVLLGPETTLAVAHIVELAAPAELSLKGKIEPVPAAQALAVLSEPARERAMGALRAPTIGRASELALLTSALEACADGVARRLTVVAPPGTGKSRLLDEVWDLAAERGADVRHARVRPDALGVSA